MVKYKVNLKFKENGKSLNEQVAEVLKVELNKKINETCNILKKELALGSTHYSQSEGCNNG